MKQILFVKMEPLKFKMVIQQGHDKPAIQLQ